MQDFYKHEAWTDSLDIFLGLRLIKATFQYLGLISLA